MVRKDCTFQGSDGEFHYIDWGGAGPIAHFAHATGHFVPMERPDETTRTIYSFL